MHTLHSHPLTAHTHTHCTHTPTHCTHYTLTAHTHSHTHTPTHCTHTHSLHSHTPTHCTHPLTAHTPTHCTHTHSLHTHTHTHCTHTHSLHTLHRYTGPLLEEDALSVAVQSGFSSLHYMHTVTALCTSLQHLCSVECTVSSPGTSLEDIEAFQLELRSFLREICCPHSVLLQGVDVLATYRNRLLLLDYLLSELMAARLNGGKQEEPMDIGQEVSHH